MGGLNNPILIYNFNFLIIIIRAEIKVTFNTNVAGALFNSIVTTLLVYDASNRDVFRSK